MIVALAVLFRIPSAATPDRRRPPAVRDVVVGLLVAGGLAAWVPAGFWSTVFLVDHPALAGLWGRSSAR
jgi:hypothetical protein